jgi:uncharacterized protein (TIRG00374 family)
MSKISIVVPAHNEEGNLYNLLDKLVPALEQNAETKNFELVIVDDNSTDQTSTIIDKFAEKDSRIKVVHRKDTPGFGNAVKTGFKSATGDIIIPVMADLSDDPYYIPKLVRKIEEGYDIAYGSRFCKGGSTDGYPVPKLIANRAFNNIVGLLFGMQHKDITNAFKAYRKEVLDSIGDLEASGFDLTVEIPLKAHILGFSSAEVPVSWHGRERGEAKLKLSENGHKYGMRLLNMFIIGNLVSLRDLFGTVAKGSWTRLFLATIVGLLLLGGIFSFSGYSDIFKLLSKVSLVYVAIACIMIFMTFILRTWRWNVLLRTSGYRVRSDITFKSIMFGWLLNYLLPARIGDVARGMALKTTIGTPLSISLSTIVVERAMDMLILALILTASIMIVGGGKLLWIAAGASIMAIGLILGLMMIYRYDNAILKRLNGRFKSFGESIPTLKLGLNGLYRNPQAIVLCLILSVPVWLFEVSSIYFSSKSIGFELDPMLSILSGMVAFVAQSIPTTPAGIGVHEGTITGVLLLFGINASTGMSIALVDHFSRGIVTYVFGTVSAIHLGFESRVYFRTNGLVKRTSASENMWEKIRS